MINFLKNPLVVGIIAVLIGVGIGYSAHSSPALVGAVSGGLIENYDPYVRVNGGINTALPIQTTGGLIVGSSGSTQNNVKFGTCNVTAVALPFAASSTATFYCAVSGITAGDVVLADFPSASPAAYGGFVINSAFSTSTGWIGFSISNYTGAATSSFPLATTSVEYYDIR